MYSLLTRDRFIPEYLTGQTVFNESSFNTSSGSGGLPPVDPRTTEDCLFLDVVVPKTIFNNAGQGSGAPVLVWIYGGGYTAGSKAGSGNPAGLIKRSTNKMATGVIYVSLNYRLGAFGFSSGPTLQADGDANAGLLDQRFALEWVQKHIAKFGGDPSRVTVFGESAGGGSIMHQITAYGGNNGPVPFSQAVPQSPGFIPLVSNQQQEQVLNDFLELANVSTVEEARDLSFAQLVIANTIQVGLAPYGNFIYGPTVDGDFAPATPGESLLHGNFAKDVKVMVGHNAQEVSTLRVLYTERMPLIDVQGTTVHLALHSEQHSLQTTNSDYCADSPSMARGHEVYHEYPLPGRLRRQPSPRLHRPDRPCCGIDL